MISRTTAVIIFGIFTLGIIVPGFVYAYNNSLALKPPIFVDESESYSDSKISLSRLLKIENFSDLGSGLKAVAVLAINLFLIVIQTVAAVLKALLPFLQ